MCRMATSTEVGRVVFYFVSKNFACAEVIAKVHQYGFYFVGVENCNDYDLAEAGRDTPDGWYPNE